MRAIVVTEFMSLDGVIENPMWTMPYWGDDIAKFKGAETDSADTLLLGRVTYEAFAAAWPGSTDEGAPYFNGVEKVVVSTTLSQPTWNNTTAIIRDDLVGQLTRLKQQPGRDIMVHGSGTLVQALMAHNLVDRYHLLVYPVVLGAGQRLFAPDVQATLRLEHAQAMSTGVVALVYTPARAGDAS